MTAIFGVLLLGVILALLLPPLCWVAGRIVRWFWMRAGRKIQKGRQTVVAQYEAPAGLRPAEVAYLYDRTFGEEELLATLFDLERREKVKLSPIEGEKGNFRVTVLCKGTEPDLIDYESDILLSCLHPTTEATWAALRTDTVLWDNPFESALEHSLQKKGLLNAEGDGERTVRWVLAGIAVLLSFVVLCIPVRPFDSPRITDIFSANPQPFVSIDKAGDAQNRTIVSSSTARDLDGFARLDAQVTLFFLCVVCLVQAALLYWSLRVSRGLYLRALNMEHGTKALRTLWPELDGYRLFLRQVELDRIHFANESDHQLVLDSALPYAVALNLTTRWQDRFM